MTHRWEEGATVEGAGFLVERDVPIPMDDGLVLRADLFRPGAEGRYPVLLSYGPYGKALPFQLGYERQWRALVASRPEVAARSTCRYQNWEVVDPEIWVPEGYVCVRVDSRGAGRSPGFLDIMSPRETRDLYGCIEWAAAQPWSNGRVGLSGISYYAINQWLVAGLQPPHLAAMCAWEGAADSYRDWNRHGGIRCTFMDSWFRGQVIPVQHGYGRRGLVDPLTGCLVAGPETLPDHELAANRSDPAQEARRRQLDDEWYRARSADWSRVTVPFLSAGNWGGQGLHLRGNVEAFVRAASTRKWLELHGHEHWTTFYAEYGLALQKRFFAHFLKEEANGWDREPRVLLNVRRVDGFEERKANEWPLAGTRWTRLYLDPASMALTREPAPGESHAAYDALRDGVTFRTPPFAEETEITGPLAAKLFISSTTTDADLFLIVQVFDTEGREVSFAGALDPRTPIAQGWLRASHRKLDPDLSTAYRPYHTHDELQPLVPGRVYEVDVEIWPTSIVIPAGYTLTLTVQGRDFERQDGVKAVGPWEEFRGCGPFLHDDPWDRRPEVYGGRVRVYGGGARASYLLVPVLPGEGAGRGMSAAGRERVVDVHAHLVPPEVVALLEREGTRLGVEVQRGPDGLRFRHREGYGYPVGPEFTSVERVLERMDEAGIDHRVLSIPPTLFFYGLPPDLAVPACRTINDAVVAFVRRGRGRLSAMIAAPLQDPERAVAEVVRLASDDAVRGVEIGTNVEERPLDDPTLEPFFGACEGAGLPVFLHPYYVGPKPRLEPYYLTNSLGNPVDTTVAAARLVHSGLLERHPGLKVLLAHGGGFYPYQQGRLEHAFAVRAEPRAACGKPPSAFAGQIYYDSVLHSPRALRYLVDAAGADHVLMGSDDPFDMGDANPVGSLERAGLSPADREWVQGRAAAALFRLDG